MRKHRRDFEDYYQACSDVFVLMGDVSCVPVLGYGTSPMKINGNVTRIVNSLHVPGLDSDLFSVTKHGRMDHGYSFLLEGGNMHLSFPKFSITQAISENGDLRVPLDPMSDEDWDIPAYILNVANCFDDYLNKYKNQIDMYAPAVPAMLLPLSSDLGLSPFFPLLSPFYHCVDWRRSCWDIMLIDI